MTTMAQATAQMISPAPSVSPASSTSTTPSTSSPTSIHSSQMVPAGHHARPASRQLRPPKSPMYVPAALRPTERPRRQRYPAHPPTPPQSSHSSSEHISRPATPSSRPTINTSLSATGTSTVPSSPTTAAQQPTRTHWKPDSAAAMCDEPGCVTTFGVFNRKHHCRRCGGIFCALHSAEMVPLDVDAEFDPNGGWYRACGICGSLWATKVDEGLKNNGSDAGSRTEALAVGGKKGQETTQGQAVSVPRDWNWSTF